MKSQLKNDLDAARIGFTDCVNGMLRATLTVGILTSQKLESLMRWARNQCYRREAL